MVCATDAGREGELIFRYIYEAAQCDKPVRRLWISSLTPDAIRKGFERCGPAPTTILWPTPPRAQPRRLAGGHESVARLLAGLWRRGLSVGRVQTPTLAMLVERELAIRKFVPEDYLEVVATFHPTGDAEAEQSTRAPGFASKDLRSNRCACRPMAKRPAASRRARAPGEAAIESIEAQTQRMPPPLLYDLTELQRHANRLFGFSAQKTLDMAQALYERHKLISYPRTDSRHLSQDVAQTLPRIVETIAAPYREQLAPGTGERPLGRRFVDDSKVTDHHAIIPTTTSPERASLSPDERKIYDLICRRLLSAWHDDHIWSVTTVITAIRNGGLVDRYHTSGSMVQQVGLEGAGPGARAQEAAKAEEEQVAAAAGPRAGPGAGRGGRGER